MTRLQGLIFDLDGTLVDSAPDLRQALNVTLKGQGRRGLTLDEVKIAVGDGMLTTLKRAFALTGEELPDDDSYRLFQEFVRHYRALPADSAQIYPHVVEVLERFKKDGIKLGICTNKQEASTHKVLRDLKIDHLFVYVAGGDSFMVHKPHPDHVRGVIEQLVVPTENCVMVGDSANDVRAAQGAGVPCLVVTHGYGGDVGSLGADGLIGGFDELQKALQKLGFS